jgi:hypothetical protein
LHILINAIVFLSLIMIATVNGRHTDDCRGGTPWPPSCTSSG